MEINWSFTNQLIAHMLSFADLRQRCEAALWLVGRVPARRLICWLQRATSSSQRTAQQRQGQVECMQGGEEVVCVRALQRLEDGGSDDDAAAVGSADGLLAD